MAKTTSKSKSPLSRSNKPDFRIALTLIAVAALVGAYAVYRSFAAAGSITLTPASSNVGLNSNFTVTIRANSGTDTVNAVEADLTFPVDKLQFVSADYTASAYGIQAVSSGDNSTGKIKIGRGVNNGGTVTGDQLVGVVTFKAIGLGSAPVTLDASSALVRSTDNTDILVTKNSAVYTVADITAPSVPTGLTAPTKTVNSVALTWTASTDDVGVTGYKIYRNGSQVGTSTTPSFTNTGLTPNTTYNFTVSAYDSAGNNSAQTAAVSAGTLPDTTAPSVPTGLTAPTKTLTSITLSWTASTDNVAVTAYKIFRSGVQIATSTSTSYTESSLQPGTSYSYTVAANDAAGNTSAQSTALVVSTLADTTAPSVPTGLSVSSQNGTTVNLQWTASSDNIAVTGYKIFRGGTQIGTSTQPSYTDNSGLVTGNTYAYSVAAYDAANNTSAQSTALSVSIFKTGDINRDNSVNIFDLSVLLSNFGRATSQSTNPNADLNGDGFVNISDLSILLSNFLS